MELEAPCLVSKVAEVEEASLCRFPEMERNSTIVPALAYQEDNVLLIHKKGCEVIVL